MATLRIGELLVSEGIITTAQLNAALTAQQIFGGRLGTNLVEHGYLDEVDLARLLSRQLGIRMVEPRELADVDPAVLGLVPERHAVKYGVVPFAHDAAKDRIALAIADPHNLQKVDEIQFAVGRRVDIFICPEVTLGWALERYYGLKTTRRYIKLAGATDAAFQLGQVETRAEPAPAPGQPGIGGLSHEEILRRIVDATSKRELVSGVVHVLSRFAAQVAFLAMRNDHLVPWEARGLGADPADYRSTSLPVSESAVAGAVVASCSGRAWDGRGDDAFSRLLAQALGMRPEAGALLVPLVVNQKTFGLFVLAGAPAADLQVHVPLVSEILRRVSFKLQIFFLSEQLSAPL